MRTQACESASAFRVQRSSGVVVWETGSLSLGSDLPVRQWLTIKAQGFHLPSSGFTSACCYTWHFFWWVWGLELRYSGLHDKYLTD